MHDSSHPERNGAEPALGAVHVPAPGPSGELTVLERLEAFRDLIRHGHALLGEVVTYCRDAEGAVAQLAADKAEVDRMKSELEVVQARAQADAESSRAAVSQLEAQRRELSAMRAELLKARAEMDTFQSGQTENAASLERSLAEARQQQRQLEAELQRVRAQAMSAQTLDRRLGQLDEMEAKLRMNERELSETRRALEEERSRRDRAIALIRPKAVAAEARA